MDGSADTGKKAGRGHPPVERQFGQPNGNPGNPGGRPKGTSLTDRLRRALDKNEGAGAEAVVASLLRAAKKEEPWAMKAIAMVFDRYDGPVKQELDHTVYTDVTNLSLLPSPPKPPPMPEDEDA